jgi:hypothetical protein
MALRHRPTSPRLRRALASRGQHRCDVIELLPLGPTADAPTWLQRPPSRHPAAAIHAHRQRRPSLSPSTTERNTWSRRGWAALALFLAVGLALTLLSGAFAPVAGYALIVVACVFIGLGLGHPVHTGLKDYRQ